MIDFVRLQATANRLIAANGVAVTLLKQDTTGEYDPGSGTVDSIPPTSLPAIAAPDSDDAEYQVRDATDTRTVNQSLRILLSIQDAVPSLGDQIVLRGQNWRIYGFTPTPSIPVVLFYRVGLCLI